MSLCYIDNCNVKILAKGLCQRHYDQKRRELDPNRSEYESWASMKSRCSPKAKEMYKYYYGRGIRVCERWANSFENFLEDMGKKPTKEHTLDRIDNDGNYEPSNCKWSTRQEQALNRRIYNLNSTGIVGVIARGKKWRAIIKKNGKSYHLGTFDTKEEAIEIRKKAELERYK